MLYDYDAIIIVPPFAGIDRPALGPHSLQAVANARGLKVQVLYFNLLFAQALGKAVYEKLIDQPPLELIAERSLAPFAQTNSSQFDVAARLPIEDAMKNSLFPSMEARLEAIEKLKAGLIGSVIGKTPIVGFSSTFEQINACSIISHLLHEIEPGIVQIMGGANCEAEMALGQAQIHPHISHVFSGESEETFVNFLSNPSKYNGKRVIYGEPTDNLEAVPCPNFDDYFSQLEIIFSREEAIPRSSVRIPYESSRGCWWGQKHHCTFCGLNGEGMAFREKSYLKVIDDLTYLSERYSSVDFFMTDNIMPHRFFRTLLPELIRLKIGLNIFYEQKSNIDLQKCTLLKESGVSYIQPGIESLSSSVLKLIDKGVSAPQNIKLLRYCRSVGIEVAWNIIYGFPGEKDEDYRRMLEILPHMVHLAPPSGLCDLSIDRFSPYFDSSSRYEIKNIRPNPSYRFAFPHNANTAAIAYHFVGDIENCLKKGSGLHLSLKESIDLWRQRWSPLLNPPILHVLQSDEGFILIDTRDPSEIAIEQISEGEARACLAPARAETKINAWAIERNYCLYIDNMIVPLATASPELLTRFEQEPKELSPGTNVGSSDALINRVLV